MNRLAVLVVSVGLAPLAVAQSPTVLSAPAPAEEVRFAGPRVIACSPLLAEMVFQMGLGDCVVAAPKFWTPPPGVELPVVADRAAVGSEAIVTLRPDILLVQQNVHDFDPVRELLPHVKVEFFRIETLDDYEQAMTRTAELIGAWSAARFRDALDSVRSRVSGKTKPRVLFGSFYNGTFAASAAGTFHDSMIDVAGGINAVAADGYKGWHIKLSNEGVMSLAPDVIVCQIAPGGEEEARSFFAAMSDVPAVRDGRVFFVTDSRWNVISMHTTQQTAALAEMLHGHLEGERIVATVGGSAAGPMLSLAIASMVLLAGGAVLTFLGRRRREVTR